MAFIRANRAYATEELRIMQEGVRNGLPLEEIVANLNRSGYRREPKAISAQMYGQLLDEPEWGPADVIKKYYLDTHPPANKTGTREKRDKKPKQPETIDSHEEYLHSIFLRIKKNGTNLRLGYDVERAELAGSSLNVYLKDDESTTSHNFLEEAVATFHSSIYGIKGNYNGRWTVKPLVFGLGKWPNLQISHDESSIVISPKSTDVFGRDYDMAVLTALARYFNAVAVKNPSDLQSS